MHRAIVTLLSVCASLLPAAVAARGEEPAMIQIEGPARMRALSQAMGQAFSKKHEGTAVAVADAHKEIGAACLSRGRCTIASLPRMASAAEVRQVRQQRSADLESFPIAMGAVVVFVHKDNPVESLTLAQLESALVAQHNDWGQLGVAITAEVPEAYCVVCRLLAEEGKRQPEGVCHEADHERRIARSATDLDSGAPDVLTRLALPSGRRFASTTEWLATTEEVAEKVAADPLGLGFGPMSDKPLAGVKIVPIRRDADSPAVTATLQTVQDRSYPLSHYVYWCFAGRPEGKAKELLTFALSPEGQEVVRGLGGGFAALPLGVSGAQAP